MSDELVVDASVVVKWLVPEEDSPIATRWLQAEQDGSVSLVAPSVLPLEVSNVITRHVRRGAFTTRQAQHARAMYAEIAPIVLPWEELLEPAVRLALANQQSVYDCLYLALALELDAAMLTADRRFHATMSRRYPLVRALA